MAQAKKFKTKDLKSGGGEKSFFSQSLMTMTDGNDTLGRTLETVGLTPETIQRRDQIF